MLYGNNGGVQPPAIGQGFDAPVHYSFAPATIEDVRTGDFNHDGRSDLVVATSFPHALRVMLQNPGGGFTLQASSISLVAEPTSVAVGEFNGNERVDLAVAYAHAAPGPDFVAIFLGDGNGGFESAVNVALPAGSGSGVGAIGDVNGDSKTDLAVSQFTLSGPRLFTLLGDGAGGFTVQQVADTAPSISPYVSSGDVNGDGFLDLVYSVANRVNIDHTGGVLDLDFDFGDTVHVRLGNGTGTFGPASVFMAPAAGQSLVADLNADGKLDLVVAKARFDGGFSILLNGCGQPATDLTVSVDDSPDPLDEGNELTYTVTVTNNGQRTATGVQVHQVLPDNSTFVSASVPDGITCTMEGDRLFSCAVRDLGPDGDLVSWTMRIVPVSGGTVSTTVGVTSNLAESTPADNTVIASTTVNAIGRELRVTNTSDDGPGSLRQAIRESNGDAGDTDRIVFDIGGGGVQTITRRDAPASGHAAGHHRRHDAIRLRRTADGRAEWQWDLR